MQKMFGAVRRPNRVPSDLPVFSWESIQHQNKIGAGTYAEVSLYSCRDHGQVAVKQLRKECAVYQKGFVKEARLLGQLSHLNVVKFLGYSSSGNDAIMLEYAGFDFRVLSADYDFHKYSLDQLLIQIDRDWDFANCEHLNHHITLGLVDGLTYLHSNGIAHRDLKPGNILVSNTHYANASEEVRNVKWKTSPVIVKLSDFGESRSNMVQTRSIVQTRTDDLYRGSPAYMAPEILRNWHANGPSPKVTIQDLHVMDVWSLAMVLFVLVNPDCMYPYEKELKRMQLPALQGAAEKAFVEFWTQGKLPQHSKKYESQRNSHWKSICSLYEECAKINEAQRPNMNIVQESFVQMHTSNIDKGQIHNRTRNDEDKSKESYTTTETLERSCRSDITVASIQEHPIPVHSSDVDGPQSDRRCVNSSSHNDGTDSDVEILSGGDSSTNNDFDFVDLTVLSLRNSQMTAITEYDALVSELYSTNGNDANLSFKLPENDATNGCTFLCLMIGARFRQHGMVNIAELKEMAEEVIDTFPAQLNVIRSKERGYDPEEALDLLKVLDLIDETFEVSTAIQGRMFGAESSDELSCLWKGCSARNFRIFVVVSPPYTVLMICNGDQIIILDTHPIPHCLGGIENGLILRAENSENGQRKINEWLQRRFSSQTSNCYVVHELEIIDTSPLHSKPAETYPIDSKSVGASGRGEVGSDNASETEESDDDETVTGIHYVRNLLRPCNWNDCEEQTSIPYDVDGLCKFRLQCDQKNMMVISQDGRPWGTWVTSSRKEFKGIRRTAACRGTPTCINAGCSLNGQQNRGQFEKEGISLICKLCRQEVTTPSCPARKVWEYMKGEVVVMYTGKHTCVAKKLKTSAKDLAKELRNSSYTSACNFVHAKMSSLMSSENIDWTAVDEVAEEFVDVKRLNNVKLKISADSHGSSFDALCLFKKETDRRDKFLIYKLNNNGMNNGLPTFVFKSSRSMAEIGLSMDRKKQGQRKGCYAFIDAKHGRTLGMKTLTLWTYDATIKMTLLLACMETEEENTESLILFWRMWNEVLQDVSGDKDYTFNPTGWVSDEHPANRRSIEVVFGDDAVTRTYSCEFHFRQSYQRHAPKTKDPDEFRRLSDRLLKVLTEQEYSHYHGKLKELCRNNNLESWLGWWHDRRIHIFRAFKPFDVPNTNLAEVGHAWLAKTSGNREVLIRACRQDVMNAIRQEKRINSLVSGEGKLGRGPSQQVICERSRKRQMKFAKEASREVAEADAERNSCSKPQSKKTKLSRSSGIISAKHRQDLPPLTRKQQEEQKKQPFEVVRRTGMMKKCFGCGCDLVAQKTIPYDLILRKLDFREYKHKATGMWHRQTFLTNTYYDLDIQCIRLKHPSTTLSSIVIPDDVHLRDGHVKILHDFGVHQSCTNCCD